VTRFNFEYHISKASMITVTWNSKEY